MDLDLETIINQGQIEFNIPRGAGPGPTRTYPVLGWVLALLLGLGLNFGHV